MSTPADLNRRPDRFTEMPLWQMVGGVLALALFAQKLMYDWPLGLAANSLWMCHVGNLALGVGLLLRMPWLTRVAVMWVLSGVPMWLLDVVLTGATTLPSVLSHAGGCMIAGVVLSCKCWVSQRFDWLMAWLGFMVAQQMARMFTAPELNVNLAHTVHQSSRAIFTSHMVYAVFIAASSALALWLIHCIIVYFKR